MASDAPRPGQTAHGVKRKDLAATSASGMSTAQVPGAMPPGAAQGPFPATMPGMPDAVQGFPQDMNALQTLMAQGFAPGSSDQAARQGMQAAAMARAMEQKAVSEAFEQEQDDIQIQQLGGLLQQLMARRGAQV